MKFLNNLLESLENKTIDGETGKIEVSSICYNSKEVEENSLFVAIRGSTHDGHDYIPEALENGACAIIVEQDFDETFSETPVIKVPNTRKALSTISATFFDHPDEDLNIVGVTGTNGKTTVVNILHEIYTNAGQDSALISTLGYRKDGDFHTLPLTTPEAPDIFELLSEIREEGIEHVAMEVSSHALAQHRVDSIDFDVGIFLNLSQDHLNFHEDLNTYFEAKYKLIENLDKDKLALINLDDVWGKKIIKRNEDSDRDFTTFGIYENADFTASKIKYYSDHTTFRVDTPEEEFDIDSALLGNYNISNALAAIVTTFKQGIPVENIKGALRNFQDLEGRLEPIKYGQDFKIFIDYAHTPEAIRSLLKSVQKFHEGHLIIIFGCGGDRDHAKRPLMGRNAAQLADKLILTTDNPRSEDPESIIEEIELGILNRKIFTTIVDREEAIRHGLDIASAGDLVLITGKGHETYQIVGDKKIPFSDKELVIEWLKEHDYSKAKQKEKEEREKEEEENEKNKG